MKKIDIKNLVIVENYPDFKPKDSDEIMLSIGWTTQELVDAAPTHSTYKALQTYDYYSFAQIDGKTIGELRAYTDRDSFATTWLESIIVHKEYQMQGVGRALMQAFHKKYAHTTIWAMATIKRDRSAVEFLKKFGYNDNSHNFAVCTKARNTTNI